MDSLITKKGAYMTRDGRIALVQSFGDDDTYKVQGIILDDPEVLHLWTRHGRYSLQRKLDEDLMHPYRRKKGIEIPNVTAASTQLLVQELLTRKNIDPLLLEDISSHLFDGDYVAPECLVLYPKSFHQQENVPLLEKLFNLPSHVLEELALSIGIKMFP